MSLQSRARALQALTCWPYQRCLNLIRDLGEQPARLARERNWPLKECDAHLIGITKIDCIRCGKDFGVVPGRPTERCTDCQFKHDRCFACGHRFTREDCGFELCKSCREFVRVDPVVPPELREGYAPAYVPLVARDAKGNVVLYSRMSPGRVGRAATLEGALEKLRHEEAEAFGDDFEDVYAEEYGADWEPTLE